MDHFIGSETTISACNWGNILSVSKSAALEILNFHVFHEIIFYNHESALILIEDNWDKKIESREVWGSCSEYSLSFSANQTLVLMIEETKSPIGWRSERFSATTQIFLWGAQMHFSCFLTPNDFLCFTEAGFPEREPSSATSATGTNLLITGSLICCGGEVCSTIIYCAPTQAEEKKGRKSCCFNFQIASS